MASEYLSFAKELAHEAGSIILAGFGRAHDISYKRDGSPVTNIDVEINKIVAERISHRYPRHGLLGEERDLGTGFESHRWICDPLDGTVSYIRGIPSSLFMLALMEESHLLMAVAYNPFTSRMYHAAKRGGAFCNGSPIHVSSQTLSEGYVAIGADSIDFAGAVRRVGGRTELVPGTGCKSMMIASGGVIGTIKGTADFHDIAPAALIVTEAGGQLTSLEGDPLILDQKIEGGVIISNGRAHQGLIAAAADGTAGPGGHA